MTTSTTRSHRSFAFLAQRRVYRDALELVLVALAFLLYFIVRASVIDRPDEALANAWSIIDLQRTLGIFVEPSWQAAILDSNLLVRFFNFVYFWLDFPVIAVLGLWLYFQKRPAYTFARDAILASGAFALVCYNLFPVAPPRLVPEIGVIDTLQVFNNLSYQAQSTEFFVNPYAAMPSLHVGWAVIVGVAVAMAYRGVWWVMVLAVLHPVFQTASTIFTGNHYLLDAAGGVVAAAFGLAVALALRHRIYPWLRRRLVLEPGTGPPAARAPAE